MKFKPPNPGELRRRITVQRRADTADSAGGLVPGWADHCSVFAKIDPLTGRELLAAQVVNAEITVEVWVRWRPEFADPLQAARYRILYGTRRLAVLSALDVDERRQFILLQCGEGLVDR